ncbi:50S ribosomal protein L3 [candidate division WOR-3 bacterium]|nr:50S ribosomal protein L3 [candidate division WOR-3 bacterium]
MKGLIGKKLGMTQIFLEDGRVVPVTVVEAGPCVVVSCNEGKEHKKLLLGYENAKLPKSEKSSNENKAAKGRRINKPEMGLFRKSGVEPCSITQEFKIDKNEEYKIGDVLTVETVFKSEEMVDVRSKTKGKGFQGVVKRYGFRGGRKSRGSMFHRAPGSIGAGTTPGRVIKGHKLPGQMGNKIKTIQNIKIIKIIPDKNLLLLKGAVPGSSGSYLRVQNAIKSRGREFGR